MIRNAKSDAERKELMDHVVSLANDRAKAAKHQAGVAAANLGILAQAGCVRVLLPWTAFVVA
jgi:hypothetical protein